MAAPTTAPPATTAFADRVEFARRARGLRVADVERAAGVASLSASVAADTRGPTILLLADALNASPGWLLDERPIATVPERGPLPDWATREDLAVMIGQRIREARLRRGLTSLEVVAAAGWAGLGEGALAQYEGGRHCPRRSVLLRFARSLDVPAAWLLAGEGPAPWA